MHLHSQEYRESHVKSDDFDHLHWIMNTLNVDFGCKTSFLCRKWNIVSTNSLQQSLTHTDIHTHTNIFIWALAGLCVAESNCWEMQQLSHRPLSYSKQAWENNLKRGRRGQGRLRKGMNTTIYRNVKFYIHWGAITVQIIGCVRKMFHFLLLGLHCTVWELMSVLGRLHVCLCVYEPSGSWWATRTIQSCSDNYCAGRESWRSRLGLRDHFHTGLFKGIWNAETFKNCFDTQVPKALIQTK